MTTSSAHRKPTSLAFHGDHWLELTATLCRKSTRAFGDWLSDELATIEEDLESYVTPQSRRKSFRNRAPSSPPPDPVQE